MWAFLLRRARRNAQNDSRLLAKGVCKNCVKSFVLTASLVNALVVILVLRVSLCSSGDGLWKGEIEKKVEPNENSVSSGISLIELNTVFVK